MPPSTPSPAPTRAPKRAIIREGRALWLSFAAATTGTFMVNVDASVVNVALPVLQHQFAVSIETLQWVVTAYLLVITGLLPVTGRVADALGRREVFLVGMATFVAGSGLSALGPSFLVLVWARAVQALGGATIMANVMAIIVLVFPVEKRGQALGLIGSVVAAGTLAGPPLGGISPPGLAGAVFSGLISPLVSGDSGVRGACCPGLRQTGMRPYAGLIGWGRCGLWG